MLASEEASLEDEGWVQQRRRIQSMPIRKCNDLDIIVGRPVKTTLADTATVIKLGKFSLIA
jgi:hypothetical protein